MRFNVSLREILIPPKYCNFCRTWKTPSRYFHAFRFIFKPKSSTYSKLSYKIHSNLSYQDCLPMYKYLKESFSVFRRVSQQPEYYYAYVPTTLPFLDNWSLMSLFFFYSYKRVLTVVHKSKPLEYSRCVAKRQQLSNAIGKLRRRFGTCLSPSIRKLF